MIDMHQSGPNTRKVFHKLLMSFHMQKKLLGAYKVTKSLIKEVFLLLLLGGGGGVGRGCKAIWRIDGFLHHTSNYQIMHIPR